MGEMIDLEFHSRLYDKMKHNSTFCVEPETV